MRERFDNQTQHARAALSRPQLRRLQLAMVLLVALLVLLGEPVASIWHCQLYLPRLLREQAHAQQHAPAPLAALVRAAPMRPPNANCFQAAREPAPTPFVPPAPLHELTIAAGLLLLGLALASRLRPRAPARLRGGCQMPPTPPPRSLAYSCR